MPAIGLYFSNTLSKGEVNALRRRLNAIAKEFGYVAKSGPTMGQGNLSDLLVAIDEGHAAVISVPDSDDAEARLAKIYQEDPANNAWAQDLQHALMRARSRAKGGHHDDATL
jgi:hypothetical protein